MTDLPPLIVVSLKMYLGVAATRAWVADVADVGARLETGAKIELAVLPTFPRQPEDVPRRRRHPCLGR